MLSIFLKKSYNFFYNLNSIKSLNRDFSSTNTLKGVNFYGQIKLGENNIIKFVEASGKITIGNHNTLNGPNLLLSSQINEIEIGNFCSIARDVTIQEYNHPLDRISTYYLNKHVFKKSHKEEIRSKGGIKIGSDVWIGTKAIILSGVHIGNGAVIAGGSIVTKDVPDYAIVAGNPARIIKYRFVDEIIEELLKLSWWDWDMERIQMNEHIFSGELKLENLKNVK